MPICKKCLLHLLSNLALGGIIWTIVALVIQINSAGDVEYWLSLFALIAIVIKSWADKKLND